MMLRNKIIDSKPIGADEEKKLINLYNSTTDEATHKVIIDKLLRANWGLIIRLSRSYYGRLKNRNAKVEYDDIFSEVCVGIINSLKHYDISKGFRFMTYAQFWVKSAVYRYFLDNRTLIKFPNNPKIDYGISVKSMDSISFVEEISYSNQSSAVEKMSIEEVEGLIMDEVNNLPDREREIVKMRYGFYPYVGKTTLKDIGESHGISKERARQLLRDATKKMKRKTKDNVTLKEHYMEAL
jgi:RNA polymerase sigma factor (sigma-70 family)